MAFDLIPIVIDGTTIGIGNGVIAHDFVAGNVKQFSGGVWNRIPIPNKDKLRQIRISGHVEDDATKTTLEGFRDSGTYSYTDGIVTLDNIVVLELNFDHAFGRSAGHQRWGVTLILA